ncbi:MAG TPA: lysylphosphatidylglycerol synthase transmembrane domain-containing protein [Candidatus Hydrogenedentes bacterium]|nr:lysylphosphatidylglycerol synthase transmembrane domain-containing protein [Candidatus Hydrogenedentota bacterium]
MKRAIQILVGILIAAALMWVLLRGVSFDELRASVGKIHWGWLFLAQLPIWLSFFLRIQRWKYVVRAVHPASFRAMFNSTQLAFLVNFTIGFRLGEIVRPLVLSKLSKMPFGKAFAVNTLDRVNDLIGLLVVMLIGVLAFRPESDIVLPKGTFGLAEPYTISKTIITTGGQGTAIGLLVVLGGLVMIYVNKNLMLRITNALAGIFSKKLAAWACHMVEQFAEGLHVFRNLGDMAKSIAYSLATWGCFLIVYALMFEAFAFDWPWYAPFIVQMLLAFAISAPGVPGMMGQFHLPIVVGILMTVPGASLPDCLALALITHVANMVPIIVFGAYALHQEGLSLAQLRDNVEEAEAVAESHQKDDVVV